MKTRISAIIVAGLLALGTADAGAQEASFGGQLNFASGTENFDADLGIGARVAIPLTFDTTPLLATGTFDFFFPDEPQGVDLTYWELNTNLSYLFGVPEDTSFRPYAGGGLNLARLSSSQTIGGQEVESSDTELGLNLLAGALFASDAPITPFAEIKLEIAGGEQFMITGGILFD